MATFVFAALAFAIVMTGMALGVIFSNKPIKGSCGGIGALGMDTACEICGGNPQVCEEETRSQSGAVAATRDRAEAGFYNADVEPAASATREADNAPGRHA